MKITLKMPDGKRATCRLPFVGAESVVTKVVCGHNGECLSHFVRGNGQNRTETQYEEEEDAVCVLCKTPRGRLHVKLDTLFGRDEDQRVLNGRYRVY